MGQVQALRFRRSGGTQKDRLAREGWRTGEKYVGSWILRKRVPNGGFVQGHELVAPNGESHDRSTWQWAEVDSPRKRLVFAEAGRICSVPLSKLLAEPKVIFDANDMTFEALRAPY